MMESEEKILIEHLKKMPPLNAALQNTLMLINDKSSDYKKISGAILKDAVLTGRVLQIANSSFYGSQRQVTDLGIACTMLGLETLRGLVYTLILLTKFRNGPENSAIDYNLLWKYCLRVACLVKNLAKEQKLDSSTAFTAGLFHCMDLIIQDYFYTDVLLERITRQPHEQSTSEQATTAEQATSSSVKISTVMDTKYWSLIAILLEYWKFPTAIVEIFRKTESIQAQQQRALIKGCSLFMKKYQRLEDLSTPMQSENIVEIKLIAALHDSDILYAELEALLFQ